MHILFLNLYSGRVERGAESFAHELASQLSPHHHVTFRKGNSTLLPTSHFSRHPLDRPLKRFFLDAPGREVLIYSLSQLSHIISHHYDLIIPLNGFWQLLLLKLLQPFKGYKLLVTGHSGPGWDERWNLYLKPNVFVATTKPTLVWAHRTAPWTKSVLIPYGIHPKLPVVTLPNKHTPQTSLKPTMPIITPRSITINTAKLSRPVILCPAALIPYKRIHLLIQAVALLPRVSLLVLGKGPLKSQLNRLGQQLLPGRFAITSAPYSHMPIYYAAAKVIALPSDPQENSPMVFIEALSAGKMIVATPSARNRWMLGRSALYTNPINTAKYAQTLKQALVQKPKPKAALAKFTWPLVTRQYLDLIEEICSD